MGDIDLLVAQARAIVAGTVANASAELAAGADVAVVQRALVAAATCLEDIEALALLAASGRPGATAAIEQRIADLKEVRNSLVDQDY